MIGAASAGNVASAQACVDAVYELAPDALALSYDMSTKACAYSLAIFGHNYRSGVIRPKYFLRVDGVLKSTAVDKCISQQDADHLIAMHSFPEGKQCPAVSFRKGSELPVCKFMGIHVKSSVWVSQADRFRGRWTPLRECARPRMRHWTTTIMAYTAQECCPMGVTTF